MLATIVKSFSENPAIIGLTLAAAAAAGSAIRRRRK